LSSPSSSRIGERVRGLSLAPASFWQDTSDRQGSSSTGPILQRPETFIFTSHRDACAERSTGLHVGRLRDGSRPARIAGSRCRLGVAPSKSPSFWPRPPETWSPKTRRWIASGPARSSWRARFGAAVRLRSGAVGGQRSDSIRLPWRGCAATHQASRL
jgi:hypothetical protein